MFSFKTLKDSSNLAEVRALTDICQKIENPMKSQIGHKFQVPNFDSIPFLFSQKGSFLREGSKILTII